MYNNRNSLTTKISVVNNDAVTPGVRGHLVHRAPISRQLSRIA